MNPLAVEVALSSPPSRSYLYQEIWFFPARMISDVLEAKNHTETKQQFFECGIRTRYPE